MNDTAIALFWGLFPLSICLLLLGYRAFKHKEIMALIKTGKELAPQTRSVDKNVLLIWAAILIGSSVGLLTGIAIRATGVIDNPVAFFLSIGLMILLTGLALLVCFLYMKRIAANKN